MSDKIKGITRKYTYTAEAKSLIKDIIKGLRKEAEYVGEDGAMVCVTNAGIVSAFKKFKRRIKQDCGIEDTVDMKIEDVGYAYLILIDDKNRKPVYEDCEWYVSICRDEISDYQVYYYNV